jgi:hypothetical protein
VSTQPISDERLAEIREHAEAIERLRRAGRLTQPEGYRATIQLCEGVDYLLAALDAVQAERDERLTKESGLALIEDAQRWQKAYCEARDALAAVSSPGEEPKTELGGRQKPPVEGEGR